MASYDESLTIYYNGEVVGVLFASALLDAAADDGQRLRWSTLLQLETETRARLEPLLVARGLSVAETDAARAAAERLASSMKGLGWREAMELEARLVGEGAMPLYEGLAADARARGDPREIAVCEHMVEHEMAQWEWVRRELDGADAADCVAPMVALLGLPPLDAGHAPR
jgi:hypothetical protein